jgi:hypothetical protein
MEHSVKFDYLVITATDYGSVVIYDTEERGDVDEPGAILTSFEAEDLPMLIARLTQLQAAMQGSQASKGD